VLLQQKRRLWKLLIKTRSNSNSVPGLLLRPNAARYFIELQQDKKLRIFNVAKGYEYETQAIKRYQSAYLAAVPYFLL